MTTTVRSTKDRTLATSEYCLATSEYLNEQHNLYINHQSHLLLQYDLVLQNHASVN